MKTCPKCNTHGQNDNARFCKKCGVEMVDAARYKEREEPKPQTRTSNAPPKKKGKLLKVGAVITSVFLCAGLVIFFMLNKNKELQAQSNEIIAEHDPLKIEQELMARLEQKPTDLKAQQTAQASNTSAQTKNDDRQNNIAENITKLSFDEAYSKGVDLCNAGKLSEAKRYLKRAVETNPRFADSYYFLGICEHRDGNLKTAKDNLQKYLQLAPNGQHAAIVRGILSNPAFNVI